MRIAIQIARAISKMAISAFEEYEKAEDAFRVTGNPETFESVKVAIKIR